MQDRTTIDTSDAFREFIAALVEEVVLEGKPFDDETKKWLQRYSQKEGVDYAMLEKNLTDFFETLEELRNHESTVLERFAKMLGKDCHLEESKVDDLLAAVNEAREKEAERIAAEKKAEEDRIAREKAEREAAEEAKRKAAEEAERKDREERERRIREEAERKAKEEADRKAREERERRAREEAERIAAEKKAEEERVTREKAEREAVEEARRKAVEEIYRKAREEAERKARKESEQKAKEERERKERDEAERRAKEVRERRAREEAERKAREEAERKAKASYEISKFFPFDGIILGKTNVYDLPSLIDHGKLGDKRSYRVSSNSSASLISDCEGNIESVAIYKGGDLPAKWTSLGFNWELSYNQCLNLMRRMGFSIKEIQKPLCENPYGNVYFFHAAFDAVSPSGIMSILFDFSVHHEASADSPNSLEFISIQYLG